MKSKIKEYNRKIREIKHQIHKGFVGQDEAVDAILKCIICNSHALLESVPGLGKTLLVKIISLVTNLGFKRVQFTPDLLPSDITGSEVYREKTEIFEVQKGPVFTNLLLADEINRAPPKVQSALLQAMEEKEVTIGKKTFKLPSPFLVFATQNPLEQQGTFPLSVAQNDRFLFKIFLGYPKKKEEFEIIERNIEKLTLQDLGIKSVMTGGEILEIYEAVKNIQISEDMKDYIMDVIEATRNPEKYGMKDLKDYIKHGVSPRATIYLPLAAKATALMKGRTYVTAVDIKEVIPYVLPHRLILSYKADAEKVKPSDIIERIIEEIPIT